MTCLVNMTTIGSRKGNLVHGKTMQANYTINPINIATDSTINQLSTQGRNKNLCPIKKKSKKCLHAITSTTVRKKKLNGILSGHQRREIHVNCSLLNVSKIRRFNKTLAILIGSNLTMKLTFLYSI